MRVHFHAMSEKHWTWCSCGGGNRKAEPSLHVQVASVPGGHGGKDAAPVAAPAHPHPHHHLVLGMSWGADHRVVDGAGLAHASNALKALLERPERMLLRTA